MVSGRADSLMSRGRLNCTDDRYSISLFLFT